MKKALFLFGAMALVLLIALPAVNGSEKDEFDSEDYGEKPWAVDIEELTLENENFRTAKWTGKTLQLTVMAIPPKGEIGLEVHGHNDQFIRIESGKGRILMGNSEDNLTFDKEVSDDWAVLIPAGTWHNIINTGDNPLKVYVLYGPPEHESGTIHKTFEESEEDHHH